MVEEKRDTEEVDGVPKTVREDGAALDETDLVEGDLEWKMERRRMINT